MAEGPFQGALVSPNLKREDAQKASQAVQNILHLMFEQAPPEGFRVLMIGDRAEETAPKERISASLTFSTNVSSIQSQPVSLPESRGLKRKRDFELGEVINDSLNKTRKYVKERSEQGTLKPGIIEPNESLLPYPILIESADSFHIIPPQPIPPLKQFVVCSTGHLKRSGEIFIGNIERPFHLLLQKRL